MSNLQEARQVITENSIRTYTGKYFDLELMDPEDIDIEDIAHGLSHTARWSGMTKTLLTVAQHSVMAFHLADDKNKLAALLHDASEAYLGDMPSPFKKLLPDYCFRENELMTVIAEKFKFTYPLPVQVKEIDAELLSLEWDAVVLELDEVEGLAVWTPEEAKVRFLEAFEMCAGKV